MTPTFQSARDSWHQSLPIVMLDCSRGQRVAIDATNPAVSDAFADLTAVMMTSSVDCFVTIGSDPVAIDDSGAFLLTAGLPFHTLVKSGNSISALSVADAGALYIVPLA
jgi:hypothetical protein